MNLKKFVKKIYWNLFKRHFYGITGPFRILPDFIIIGAMKSGTTSLSYNISEHPCVLPPAYDEIGFFDVNFDLGFNWYKSLFPTTFKKNKILSKYGFFSTGDDTPFYFWREDAVIRIKQFLPSSKFLVILRNPIDRAYSNYVDELNQFSSVPSFEDMIQREIEIIDSENNYCLSKTNFKRYSRNPSHIAKGFYAEQLEIWFKHFERNQFFIISTEDLSMCPYETMNKIYNFLELPAYSIKNPQKKKSKIYLPMKTETRKFLIEYYKPHNKKLFNLIGKNFNWDK